MFLLGAGKAGSTTLARVLMAEPCFITGCHFWLPCVFVNRSMYRHAEHCVLDSEAGITSSSTVIRGKIQGHKESQVVPFHFASFLSQNMTDSAVQKQFAEHWRALFPACLPIEIEKVMKNQQHPRLMDFSSGNLALTDPSFGGHLTSISVTGEDKLDPWSLVGFDLPPALRHSYGETSKNVRFVVLLRETIARWQSQLYHMRSHARKYWIQPGPQLIENLRTLVENKTVGYGLWNGLYGRHLLEWFSYWHASQFLVLPYKFMTSHTELVCESMMKHLETNFTCSDLKKHINWASRPSLEQEVPVDLLQQAWKACVCVCRFVLIFFSGIQSVLPGSHNQEWCSGIVIVTSN